MNNISLSYTDTSNALTKLKKDPEKLWLKAVSSVPLQHRKDFLHKLSTKLVSESQAIYTETLAVKNMMANHKLALTIADCSWGELLRQLEYKCKWYGRELVAIDRWFPSSKRCNRCGHILERLPLKIREWTCPSCNSQNLRDLNAALNIKAVEQTVFACGSG